VPALFRKGGSLFSSPDSGSELPVSSTENKQSLWVVFIFLLSNPDESKMKTEDNSHYLSFLVALEFELRASLLLSRHSNHLSYQPFVVLGIFEIVFCKLFARGWLQTTIFLISAS
jgi:hypothetical protein